MCATNFYSLRTLSSDVITLHINNIITRGLCTFQVLFIILYSSTLNIADCTFTRNNISSIKTIGSNVTMFGKVLFHNNTASSGTCLIFAKNSLLITTDYSNIDFKNNHAINYDGVFYITTEESYQTSIYTS